MADIPDTHIEFARELVTLARKHSMNNLKVEFDHSGSKNWREPASTFRYNKTYFTWNEGRHGATTDIHMERNETLHFKEVSSG